MKPNSSSKSNLFFYDKSGYNRHLARNVDCESARSFRFVYKRMFVDEAAAQRSAAEFRDACS